MSEEQTDWKAFASALQDKVQGREYARRIWDDFLVSLGLPPREPDPEDLDLIAAVNQKVADASLLADPDLKVSLDQMRRGETVQARTAAEEACPGERSPSTCKCPCYGCKHHCAAHQEEGP